jgi:hypothetical protein
VPRTVTITQDDIRRLTVGDLELLEERTGRGLSRLFDADAPRGVLLHSLAWIRLRDEAEADGRPVPSWEDAGRVIVELGQDGEGVAADPSVEVPAAAGRRTRRAG